MRPSIAIALLALGLAALTAGCGKQDASTADACLEGPAAYVQALDGAPGEVTLSDDETQISDCLSKNQESGDLAAVGEGLVGAATRLNDEARAEPGGDANIELGYLIGAAQRGADRTEGIHTELVRRLAVAARYSPGREQLTPAFLAAYRRGFDAGLDHG